ncbi:TetR family transcriptional regulator [Nocardia terpenica]|uniref:acyl-CoA-like ligand-binding transcription factor n=1 Tax=Nocardia terpenica TaxID=455432 RepID=UPI002FE23513
MPTEQTPGLRERKKLDTRKALSDAALELVFEVGLENVVREDIAARAGVSVRTFNNYFNGKFDALAYRQIERMHRTIAAFRARPADEPTWTAVTTAVLETLESDRVGWGAPTAAQMHEIRKFVRSPEVQASMTRGALDEFVAAIAERTGLDPHRHPYPRLVAGITLAVHQSALEVYIHADPPVIITDLLREAFAAVAAGLPDPSGGV